jgi:hypothetical protein
MTTSGIRVFGYTLALGSVLIGTCAAQDTSPRTSNPVPPSARLPQNADQRMGKLDSNGDGIVSEDEYEDGVREAFAALDADHNNRVSADELAVASGPQADGMPSAADRIRGMDMNTDGELTEEELNDGAERGFQRLDTNQDGTLDIGELKSGGPIMRP